MEIITIPTNELFSMVKQLSKDKQSYVKLTLTSQEGNPSDEDDFYPSSVNFIVNGNPAAEDYGSIFSPLSHNNFKDDDIINSESINISVDSLFNLSRKILKDNMDLVELKYSAAQGSAVFVNPSIGFNLEFYAYNQTNVDNKLHYGTIGSFGDSPI